MGNANLIGDFGEKIGGAKKDNWSSRNLDINDLADMNEMEKFKYVTKENIWKKLDYKKLVENGMQPGNALLIKKIYDSYPAKLKPLKASELNSKYIENYIKFTEVVRNTVESVKDDSDFTNLFNKIFIDNEYYKKSSAYNGGWLDKVKEINFISNKFVKVIQVNNLTLQRASKEANDTGFPEVQEAWRKNIRIIEDRNNNWAIVKKSGVYNQILENGFSSKEEAEKHLVENLKPELTSRKNSIKIVRPQLASIQRSGNDYRNGSDVTTDEFMNTFGFRGGEFGNWNTQADRQQNLNMAYDSLMDLSRVLNIKPNAISLNGELAIAFGARGSGNALAHYEPARVVINLTKMKGAGSLAHEWGHALDDYYGRVSGDRSITERYASSGLTKNSKLDQETKIAWKGLMNILMYRDMTNEEIKAEAIKDISKTKRSLKYSLNEIRKELDSDYGKRPATQDELIQFDKLNNILVDGDNLNKSEAADKIFSMYKDIKDFKISKGTRDNIGNGIYWLNIKLETLDKVDDITRSVDSDFYAAAKILDENKSKPYYTNRTELFARSFESYIEDKLKSEGNKSHYLVHSTNVGYGEYKPYPSGDEREKIFKEYETFIGKLKELERNNVIEINTPMAAESINLDQEHEDIRTIRLNGIDYKENDVISRVEAHINELISKGTISADEFEIVDMAIYGRRTKGVDNLTSDIDVVMEYKGDIREDDLFNILNNHDYSLQLEGYYVDINPITESKTGTIEQFLNNQDENVFDDNTKASNVKSLEDYAKDYDNELNIMKDKIKDLDAFKIEGLYDNAAIVSPSTKEPGKIQITFLDKNNEPLSDTQLSTMDQVAARLVDDGYSYITDAVKFEVKAKGNITYDELKALPGGIYVIKTNESNLDKINNLDIPYTVFTNKDNCSLIIKDYDKSKVMEAIGLRNKEIGDILYDDFKKLPGSNRYIEISSHEFDKLKSTNLKYAAFDKVDKINLVVKEDDLTKTLELMGRGIEIQYGNTRYNVIKNLPGETTFRIYSAEQLELINKTGVKYAAFDKGEGKFNIAFKAKDLNVIHEAVKAKLPLKAMAR